MLLKQLLAWRQQPSPTGDFQAGLACSHVWSSQINSCSLAFLDLNMIEASCLDYLLLLEPLFHCLFFWGTSLLSASPGAPFPAHRTSLKCCTPTFPGLWFNLFLGQSLVAVTDKPFPHCLEDSVALRLPRDNQSTYLFTVPKTAFCPLAIDIQGPCDDCFMSKDAVPGCLCLIIAVTSRR